jgi:phage tail-like protein
MPAIEAARFSITIDGYEIASFSELQGISSSVDVVDYVESQENVVLLLNRFVRARPPISLRLARPRGSDTRISTWHQQARTNPMTARKKCTLALYGDGHQATAKYYLESAWPSKIEPGGLTWIGGRPMSTEKVTLTCEDIQRISP